MPLGTLHLFALSPNIKLLDILKTIQSLPSHQPIILSKPIRWIITPELIDTEILRQPWDLLYIHLGTEALPPSITSKLSNHYTLQTGIPSRLLTDFPAKNKTLLHPSTTPDLTGSLKNPALTSSAQDLSLSHDLQRWISSFSTTKLGSEVLSMLNLLSFHPTLKHKYITYGQQFAQSIGSKRGGNAKLVGHIVYPSPSESSTVVKEEGRDGTAVWEEFALAQYPSISHFADMLASADYQAVNQEFRVPALRDTCILCTSEIEIEDLLQNGDGDGNGDGVKSKL